MIYLGARAIDLESSEPLSSLLSELKKLDAISGHIAIAPIIKWRWLTTADLWCRDSLLQLPSIVTSTAFTCIYTTLRRRKRWFGFPLISSKRL